MRHRGVSELAERAVVVALGAAAFGAVMSTVIVMTAVSGAVSTCARALRAVGLAR